MDHVIGKIEQLTTNPVQKNYIDSRKTADDFCVKNGIQVDVHNPVATRLAKLLNEENEKNKKLIGNLVLACEMMQFSFDEVREKEGYPEALKRFCKAKRKAMEALSNMA